MQMHEQRLAWLLQQCGQSSCRCIDSLGRVKRLGSDLGQAAAVVLVGVVKVVEVLLLGLDVVILVLVCGASHSAAIQIINQCEM